MNLSYISLEYALSHYGINPCLILTNSIVLRRGFERLVQFMTGIENIRDVIAFPRIPGNYNFYPPSA